MRSSTSEFTKWRKAYPNGHLFILGFAAAAALSFSACTKDTTDSTPASTIPLELVPFADGFTHPLNLQAPDDGTGRVFVVEQGGFVKIIRPDGQVNSVPFLDVSGKLSSGSGEEGLLGMAFHPHYATNGRFFVNYTSGDGGLHTVIAEYAASAGDGGLADPSSGRILLTVDQPFPNHNGGGLAFGTDGFLYIALGDGGSGGDPNGNAQNVNVLLGKILRIDVDSTPAAGLAYAIPPDNPFVNRTGRDEIWLYGLRNPFRFSVDPETGDLWIGDVGQNSFEEVDRIRAREGGANLGWNIMEGTHCYPPSGSCATAGLTLPIFDYPRDRGDKTVIGGYVYRGSMPEWNGIYLYGDYCTGFIWGLIHTGSSWQKQQLFDVYYTITSFGQDPSGEIYLVSDDGGVYKLVKK